MALSGAERYAARLLRWLSRAFLVLLGLLLRASSLAAPAAPSPPALGSPPAAAAAACAPSSASRKARCVPAPTQELLLLPGVELARRIRSKEVTCINVIETYIGRIKEVNPLINALVKDRFEAALQEAHQVDKLLSEGHDDEESLREKFPYLGVPITIKEAFELQGMPNTSGLVNRRHIISTMDATVVSRLKQAGAIPLGVTNCSELCMWYESSNLIYGRSKNPYDLERIVGGSSGGEGCILAAAGSVIGVGSDIGGSIRMPAFFNGIFGHKPSTGVVPNEGQFPSAVGIRKKFLCTGPMCRYTEDLEPMLRIMAGSGVAKLKLDEKVSLQKLKFYFMEHDGGSLFVSPVDKEMLQALRKVVENLETKLGAEVQHVSISKMKYALQIWSVMMSGNFSDGQKIPNFTDLLGDHGKPVWPSWELLKWTVGRSSHTLPAIALGLTEKFVNYSPKVNTKLEGMARSLQAEMVDLLKDDGIFLYPSHPIVAPRHHEPLGMPFNFAYTAIFNILGLPVTQCPLGLSREGLPLGIQVVAGANNDHLSLAMARYLEKEFGGWVCPGRC
uniref:fatty-acid amide hydrolase 2 n=1 Tax=Euleptes europaea TaxID=460621 RepID=UPI00254001F0|nr:fatty-acid amide hydrolase 2 [Euleptes europaea]